MIALCPGFLEITIKATELTLVFLQDVLENNHKKAKETEW